MMSMLQESKQNNPTVDSPNHRRTGSLCLSPDLGPECIALPTRGRAIQGDITPILTKPDVINNRSTAEIAKLQSTETSTKCEIQN